MTRGADSNPGSGRGERGKVTVGGQRLSAPPERVFRHPQKSRPPVFVTEYDAAGYEAAGV